MNSTELKERNSVEFSIIIGYVSTEDETRILECLNALRKQQSSISYEVIIADRRNCDISKVIASKYSEVTLFSCDKSTSLPEMRTRAMRKAVGDYIAVIEDHCIPDVDWLAAFKKAFLTAPPSVVAVGGCVENGVTDTSLDWATFLCEYSYFLPPLIEGVSEKVPGMNVAYKKDVFTYIDDSTLYAGFWEISLHPTLLAQGNNFLVSNNIRLFHSKKFSFAWFVSQRFIYSRYFAGNRFKKEQYGKRIIASALSLTLLPPVLLTRITKHLMNTKYQKEMIKALPFLFIFVCVWGAGEAWGYLLGDRQALNKIE